MKLPNNKILLLILVVLVVVFVLSRKLRTPSLQSNLPESILAIDTSAVTQINISPSSDKANEITLLRQGGNWQVKQQERANHAATAIVDNALSLLIEVKPERVISRKKEKWSDYQVDSTGAHVTVLAGEKELASLWIGKNTGGSVYVRKDGEDDVYAVSGSLNSTFNKKYDEWRNKSFLRVNTDSVSVIAFTYPADSSYTVTKTKEGWSINDVKADSIKVKNYLNKFQSRNLYTFADDFVPGSTPDLAITLRQQNTQVETIHAWKQGDDNWVVTSTFQPDVYFSVTSSQLIKEFFVGRNAFMQ